MPKPTSFTDPATVAILGAIRPTAGESRHIIHYWCPGGMDTHNLVVPAAGNSNRAAYETQRPVPAVGLSTSEILPLSGTDWGLHPGLAHLRDRWDTGKLAIIRDVGILNEPTTRANLLADRNRYTPIGSAAHNTQQELWVDGVQHLPPNRDTGWPGRFGSLLDGLSAWNREDNNTLFSIYPRSERHNRTFTPQGGVSIPAIERLGAVRYGSATINQVKQIRERLNNAAGLGLPSSPSGNTVVDSFRFGMEEILANQVYINTKLVALPGPVNTILNALTGATKTQVAGALQQIYTSIQNTSLGIRATCSVIRGPGGDDHAAIRANQDPRASNIYNTVLATLTSAIAELGLTDRVVIFTGSEFGRTLRANNNLGTDHGWTGHHFVMGGPVIGGLYGGTPNYTPAGPWDTATNGNIFFPQVSTEQYYNTLLRWVGVPDSLIPLILPAWSYYNMNLSTNNMDFLTPRN